MKKLLASLLAVAMTFALVSCGNSDTGPAGSPARAARPARAGPGACLFSVSPIISPFSAFKPKRQAVR